MDQKVNQSFQYTDVPFSVKDFAILRKVCADSRLGLYKQAGYDGRSLFCSFSDYFRNACLGVVMPYYDQSRIAVMQNTRVLGILDYDRGRDVLRVSKGGIFDGCSSLRSLTCAIVDHVCLSENVEKFRDLSCGACEQVTCLVEENGGMRHFFFPEDRYDVFHAVSRQYDIFSVHEPLGFEAVLKDLRDRYQKDMEGKGVVPGYVPARMETLYFTGKELLSPEKAMLRRDMLFAQVFDNALDPVVSMDVVRVAMSGISAALDSAAAGDSLQDVPSLLEKGPLCYENASFLNVVPDGPVSVNVCGMLPCTGEVRVNTSGQPEFVFRGVVQATGFGEVVSAVSSLLLSEENILVARKDVSLYVRNKIETGLRRSLG